MTTVTKKSSAVLLFLLLLSAAVDGSSSGSKSKGGKGGSKSKGGGSKSKGGKGGSKGKGSSKCRDSCEHPEYVYNPTPMLWEAHHYQAMARGCELASIHSREELDLVFAQVSERALKKRYNTWLGGRPPNGREFSTDPNGWEWSDATCWDYSNWRTGQPSGQPEDPNGPTCLEMYTSRGTKRYLGQWNDIRCDTNSNAAVYKCCKNGNGNGNGNGKGKGKGKGKGGKGGSKSKGSKGGSKSKGSKGESKKKH